MPNENISENPQEKKPEVQQVPPQSESPVKETVSKRAKTSGAGAKGFFSSSFMSLLPLIAKVLLGLVVLAGAGFGLKKILQSNEIKILDTPTVVKEIRKISELTTYTYMEEFVLHGKKMIPKNDVLKFLKKDETPDSTLNEIVIITKGVARAGYNFGKLTEKDLTINGDTLVVRLPSPEILDVIMNPSDNIVFVEDGKWSHEEITDLQVNCKKMLIQNAMDRGILQNADKTGKDKVEHLFKALGFTVVTVIPSSDSLAD